MSSEQRYLYRMSIVLQSATNKKMPSSKLYEEGKYLVHLIGLSRTTLRFARNQHHKQAIRSGADGLHANRVHNPLA